MESVPWNAPSGLEVCITTYLAEHPEVTKQSNRVSHISGTDDLWLTPPQAAQFAEWAQRKGFLSSHDAHRLITGIRQAFDPIHNHAQHTEGREP